MLDEDQPRAALWQRGDVPQTYRARRGATVGWEENGPIPCVAVTSLPVDMLDPLKAAHAVTVLNDI
jgi:hypothetical protein